MLSIGEFSKICEVSTKTLRYYSEIGLIYPDEINPENGYRYYSIEQLKKMLFINRLKSYEFSLEEIKSILTLEKEQSDVKLCLALHRKKRELQDKISAYKCILRQLKQDILNTKNGISIMSYFDDIDVQLEESSSMNILSIRKVVSADECVGGYGKFFDLLYKKIAIQNLTMVGPPMAIYHSIEYSAAGYDIEFAIPIKEIVTGTRNFVGELCVKTLLKGPYSELTSIYAKQREWAEKENYEFIKSPFDIYVTNPEQVATPDEMITEIYYPIKKK